MSKTKLSRVVALILYAALATTPAYAQQADTPTAEGASATHIIQTADANDLFTVSASSPSIAVHSASGLICEFGDGAARNRIDVYPQLARGDDVGCEMPFVGGSRTFYATRYPYATSAAQELQEAAAIILMRFPDAQEFRGQTISLQRDDMAMPPTHSAAFLAQQDAELLLTSVHLAEQNGWVYKMRYTRKIASEADAESTYTVAQLFFGVMLTQMTEARRP